MTKDELAVVLDKHKKWLNNEEGGERADLRYANLCSADLCSADLREADLRDANLDYSAWPLWCGSLGVHIDDRLALQLLYHTLYNVAYSEHVSDEVKRTLLTPEIVALANRSHVVSEHRKNKIKPYTEGQP